MGEANGTIIMKLHSISLKRKTREQSLLGCISLCILCHWTKTIEIHVATEDRSEDMRELVAPCLHSTLNRQMIDLFLFAVHSLGNEAQMHLA